MITKLIFATVSIAAIVACWYLALAVIRDTRTGIFIGKERLTGARLIAALAVSAVCIAALVAVVTVAIIA